MGKSKKMAVIILAAMLAVSSSAATAVTVSAEEDTAVVYSSSDTKSWGDYEYQVLDDGTVEIMRYKGYDTNLVIPSEVDGKKVTQITNMFDGFEDTEKKISLESVVIPEGITTISNVAFNGCSSLENIIIPDSLTTIGYCAFYNTAWYDAQPDGLIYLGKVAYEYKGDMPQNTEIILRDDTISISPLAFNWCEGLTSITIPDSVKEIGYSAFDNCTSLKNITVSNNNNSYCSENGVLFNKDKTKLILYPGKKADAKYSIPNSVVIIGNRAFASNKSIESIEIPDSVQEICEGAFLSCEKLKNINIPNSVITIGGGDKGVFANCTSLTNITIPDSITTIPWYTFSGCTGLTNVTISNSVNTIDCGAFSGCTGLKNITIPDSVTEIESNAFAGCSGLESINISDGVTILSNSVFDGCTSLKDVKIPNSVTLIGNWTFNNCKSLTSIVIPNSVEKIASGAFSNCNNLKSVTILNSAAEIVDGAFDDSQDLTIYGYVGSTAETYANENNLPFVDINSKVLTSKVGNISVRGDFDDGVTLNVEEATVPNAVTAYNITLKDENGNTIQPSGKITVTIPSQNGNCKVYWIKEDGTKVDMNATYSNGNYEFTTDHLSVYALIADTTKPSETGKNAVETGDSNNLFAMAAMLAGAVTAITTIIFKKKRT